MAPADDRKTWQEISYWVLAGIWAVYGAYDILQGVGVIPSVWTEKNPFFSAQKGGAFIGSIGGIHLFIGIGLFLEQGWVQFITKIMCWLGIAWNCWMMVITMFTPHPLVPLLMELLFIGLYSVQLHVIATVGDA